jgi:hypothetical protein
MGYSSAAVETALDLPALATHYTSQLEKVGWIRRDGGQDGVLAWSTWTFRDETGDSWEGVLYITRRPDRPNQYILQVRAECVE